MAKKAASKAPFKKSLPDSSQPTVGPARPLSYIPEDSGIEKSVTDESAAKIAKDWAAKFIAAEKSLTEESFAKVFNAMKAANLPKAVWDRCAIYYRRHPVYGWVEAKRPPAFSHKSDAADYIHDTFFREKLAQEAKKHADMAAEAAAAAKKAAAKAKRDAKKAAKADEDAAPKTKTKAKAKAKAKKAASPKAKPKAKAKAKAAPKAKAKAKPKAKAKAKAKAPAKKPAKKATKKKR
jgi:hypothetical protein